MGVSYGKLIALRGHEFSTLTMKTPSLVSRIERLVEAAQHTASTAGQAELSIRTLVESAVLDVFHTEAEISQALTGILKKQPRSQKGVLIVFEGIDGAGKTTQAKKLTDWLKDRGYPTKFTKWNSSEIVSKAIQKAKDERAMTPMLYSLLHACDLLMRYKEDIHPALEEDRIVVADRYVYTSYVRDKLRGVDTSVLDRIYSGLRAPDILFHCVLPIRLAFERILHGKKDIHYYAAGMDIGYSPSKEESLVKYSAAMDREYKAVLKQAEDVYPLDMAQSIEEIFQTVRKALAAKFGIGKYQTTEARF